MERYVVVYKWGESYKNPIILKKDEKVIVNLTREADTEWELGLVYIGRWNERLGADTNFECM